MYKPLLPLGWAEANWLREKDFWSVLKLLDEIQVKSRNFEQKGRKIEVSSRA